MITLPATIIGQGTAVVLLHGFPLDGRTWLNQAQALSNEFQVIVPDQRGFGQARPLAAGQKEITIDQAADDIAELLNDHKVAQAVIGGISRGGYIAMSFARRYPERLLGLMLFDTRATPADNQERQTYKNMADRLAKEDLGFVSQMMESRLFGPTALANRRALVDEVNRMILEQHPPAVAAAARGMANRPDARPGLSSLRIPVLAVAGREDGAYAATEAIADAVAAADGDSRFIEIPNAGHLCTLERPELATQIMREFLAAFREKPDIATARGQQP